MVLRPRRKSDKKFRDRLPIVLIAATGQHLDSGFWMNLARNERHYNDSAGVAGMSGSRYSAHSARVFPESPGIGGAEGQHLTRTEVPSRFNGGRDPV